MKVKKHNKYLESLNEVKKKYEKIGNNSLIEMYKMENQ